MKHIIIKLLILVVLQTLVHAEDKLALLIGNSAYKYIEVLHSPQKDIPALARKLRGLGFAVMEYYDLDEKSMKKVVKTFKAKLLRLDNPLALFYYSGHGSQAYGESYLIPIDGDTRDQGDVEADGVKVENIAQKMANAGTVANILFLDACRDVPTGTMGGTKGLGQVKRQPSSTLILYSTSKNHTAKDDRVFNKTVLEKLAMNVPISSLANDISYEVGRKTSREQNPEILSTGLPQICLSGSCREKQQEVRVVEKIVYRDRVIEPRPQETRRVDSSTTNQKGITTIDGLMYQNQPFTKEYTWKEAKEYCQDLTLGGYRDWRLPTRAELMKLGNIKLYDWNNRYNWKKWFNKNKNKRYKNSKNHYHFIRKEFIENMPEDSYFWTSEEIDSSSAWNVYFRVGDDTWDFMTVADFVLCVSE